MMIDMKTAVQSLVLNIANIVIMFLIVRVLVYKPVKNFMAARKAGVEKDLADAEEKLKLADEAKAEAETARANAAQDAEAEKVRILDAAAAEHDRIIADANAQAERMRDEALAEAAHSADVIMDDMRENIADIAVELAGEIVGHELDRSGSSEIIDQYFDKVAKK